MLAVAHLMLKSFIKDELPGESSDPLVCFTKLQASDPNHYLELGTLMEQSK